MARKQRERVKVSKDAWKKAIKIFRFLKPYKIKFSIGLIFLLLSSASSMLFPGLMGKLIDAESGGPVGDISNLSNINTIALVLFGVFVIQAFFSFFRILLFSQVTENMLADLRKFTYRQLILLPMPFYNKHRVGELNSRISSDISLLQETFTTTVAEFLRQIFTIIAGIVFLSFYSVELTLLMLGVLPVVAISAVVFGKKVRGLAKKTQDEVASSNVIVEETLTAISAVKSFMNEQFEYLRYGKVTDTIKQLGIKNAIWRGFFASFIILAMFGSIVLVIWYGMKLKLSGDITTGDLMSFIIYSVFVGASFGGIADLFTQIQKAVGATERLLEIIEEKTEDLALDGNTDSSQLDTIAFENTSFSYPSRSDVEVLNKISFSIKRGEKVAIVGPSGSGKSTITNLLLQFYRNYEGSILLNGEELKNKPLSSIRQHMGIVPQEVLLFGGSIRENIAYGNTNASQEEIEAAAKIANAEEFIVRFPEGYDTIVGERGVQLSGGQRQRIAIARAVLRDPELLILDEATSSLDSGSESLIQDALEKVMADRTNLIIAHRLSTVKNADKIIVLYNGDIVEVGTHNELIALENGKYKELSQVQLA
jgi:ABC-type multidrug transport system fused ATPase/permease subunit